MRKLARVMAVATALTIGMAQVTPSYACDTCVGFGGFGGGRNNGNSGAAFLGAALGLTLIALLISTNSRYATTTGSTYSST